MFLFAFAFQFPWDWQPPMGVFIYKLHLAGDVALGLNRRTFTRFPGLTNYAHGCQYYLSKSRASLKPIFVYLLCQTLFTLP